MLKNIYTQIRFLGSIQDHPTFVAIHYYSGKIKAFIQGHTGLAITLFFIGIFLTSITTLIHTKEPAYLAFTAQVFAFFVLFPQVFAIYKGETTENISAHTFKLLMVIHFCYFAFGVCLDNPLIYLPSALFALLIGYILAHLMPLKLFYKKIKFHVVLWGGFLCLYSISSNFSNLLHHNVLLPNIFAGIAGIYASICFWPQSWKIIKKNDSEGVSLLMYICEVSLGIVWSIWAFWGWYQLEDDKYFTQLLFNSITCSAALFVIFQILHKRK